MSFRRSLNINVFTSALLIALAPGLSADIEVEPNGVTLDIEVEPNGVI